MGGEIVLRLRDLLRAELRLAATLVAAIAYVLAAPHAAVAAPNPLHAGCYAVIDPGDAPTIDNAQEVLCVDASGKAVIRESSYYGEGVKGCNVVTVSLQGPKIVIDVNYKRCANDAPSHKLTCDKPGADGSLACSQVMEGDNEALAVKLAPLPKGQ